MTERLLRHEVDMEHTWDLSDLYASDADWEEAVTSLLTLLPSVTAFQGHLGESAEQLFQCLSAHEQLMEQFVRVSTYASLRQSEDGTNPANQANSGKMAAVSAEISAGLAFINSEIAALPDGVVENFLEEYPELSVYRKSLQEILDYKPYLLSPQTEATLASLGQALNGPYLIYQRGKSADMQFRAVKDSSGAEHTVSFALYEDVYEFTADTELRRNAFDSFASTLRQYQNTFAATYATEIAKQVALARLRGFASTTDMLLHPQQVTRDMYENLLDIIQTDLAPHMRRLARLRQRVLGLETMRHCDLKVPLDPDFNPQTTISQASQLIIDALEVLGPEYVANIRTGLSSRWVDYVDNVGKGTGAFCSSPYGVHPFILLTWGNTMRSTFVLAHELGHAGHFALANRYQKLSNTRPSMYFIEAPSTMNEMLLADHILGQTTDQRMRRWVISQLLGTYYHNYVTHLLEAELQRRVYTLAEAGKSITASLLSAQKGDVLSSFWGDAVTIDEAASLTWMRQPHYYMGLYPYTYSAGLTASTAIAKKIREEGTPAAEAWVNVLKQGGTKSPLELMKMAGVDMSKPGPIREAVAYVGSLIDELERSFD
ncbi:MAG: oligoendopeptidase F [Alicyclobacillaceae bacterium]|nr:oligoendopeptidase F [Alicyclobacillaceae bacterium]